MTTQTIAGITIPDTPLVKEVTEYIRDVEDDLLFDHSRRVFLFGALQGQRRGLEPDLELLYVGAMFHDIGLTTGCRTSMLRFEIDGANAARDFLLERGFDEPAARTVWLGIALHTTPNIPEFLEPEIALVTAGVETDVLGIGRDDLPEAALDAVTAAHPRPERQRGRAGPLRPDVRAGRLRRDHSGELVARVIRAWLWSRHGYQRFP
jgi:hypothetical protein